MTVRLTYTTTERDCTKAERDTLFDAVSALHATASDTGGTYRAERCAYQPDTDGWQVHIGVSLTDADDSQYPACKDDLSETLAAFDYDLGTASEIKSELQGEIQ